MLYLANPTGEAIEYMKAGILGFIDTPAQGNLRPAGVTWCADNGCFSSRFKESHWWAWLEANAVDARTCLFATAPDVVGDAAATLERSLPWLPKIRDLGYPAAFVAQDGQEGLPVPWDEFDVLFLGGQKTERPADEWKLSAHARELAAEAIRLGKKVHMGRVNSRKRFRYAHSIGCDSVDGTYLTFGPRVNLPKLLSWIREIEGQAPLF